MHTNNLFLFKIHHYLLTSTQQHLYGALTSNLLQYMDVFVQTQVQLTSAYLGGSKQILIVFNDLKWELEVCVHLYLLSLWYIWASHMKNDVTIERELGRAVALQTKTV